MNINSVAILTSKGSWFLPFARELKSHILEKQYNCELYSSHEGISEKYDVVFLLSYFNIVPKSFLNQNLHNLVVHESDLPLGKGWAPLFWQILEGKNEIPIVLFEALSDVDNGDIYLKDTILLNGNELNKEIRSCQANKTIDICLNFLDEYHNLSPYKQKGEEFYYEKRSQKDSELDINKSIKDQINLLRIVDNEEYPAFFVYNDTKYILKISKKNN